MQCFSQSYYVGRMAVVPSTTAMNPQINDAMFRSIVEDEYDGQGPPVFKVEDAHFATAGDASVPVDTMEIPEDTFYETLRLSAGEMAKEVFLVRKERQDILSMFR